MRRKVRRSQVNLYSIARFLGVGARASVEVGRRNVAIQDLTLQVPVNARPDPYPFSAASLAASGLRPSPICSIFREAWSRCRDWPLTLDTAMGITGRNACPPEDVGGTPGYEELVDAIRDPANPEHETMLQWCGGAFDPARLIRLMLSSGSTKSISDRQVRQTRYSR